jgi:ABC-type oligopeptide transport system ATPase subunit
MHRIASHRIASHRIASHRVASWQLRRIFSITSLDRIFSDAVHEGVRTAARSTEDPRRMSRDAPVVSV